MEWLAGISDERWVDIITKISLLSAAGFGLLGLLTEYRNKEGRITVWGKTAAVGIVASAVLSIASGVFQDRIEANNAKAAKKRSDEEAERFQRQLTALGELNRQIGEANETSGVIRTKSDATLVAQSKLLSAQNLLVAGSKDSLLRMAGLSADQRSSTSRMLRSLWDEANRITGNGIQLDVTTQCEMDDGAVEPQLLGEGAATFVTLLTEELMQEEREGRLDGLDALGGLIYSYRVDLTALPPAMQKGAKLARFHSFTALFPDSVASPDVWRTGGAQITIASPFTPELERIDWQPRGSGGGPSPGERKVAGTPVVKELPCEAEATLFVNGRMVLNRTAPVDVVRDIAGKLSLAVEYPALRPEEGSIPAFVGEPLAAGGKRPY